MKKLIGVLGRPTLDDEEDSVVGIYEGIRSSIIKKGCIPFMIVPLANVDYVESKKEEIPKLTEEEKQDLRDMIDLCSGIIIPGGYRWYEYDIYAVTYAMEKDIPILGICMGMQLLATIDNQDKCLELNETKIEHRQRRVKYVHKVNVEEGTLLHAIVKKQQIEVNSKHRYHVTKVNQFKIAAVSEDGLIEAIEMPNKKFVMGVQWHPEKMLDYDESANQIYDKFIEQCSQKI